MSSTAAETRRRLEKYPDRLRARLAGRVVQVTLSAPGEPPRYEAIVEVEKSRPLPPVSIHALTGIPLVERIGDDLDDSAEVSADDDSAEASDFSTSYSGEDDAGQNIPLYRVFKRKADPKSVPLYPDYPPIASGDRVKLIWHGQKFVPGILAGTYLRCSGMLSLKQNPKQIFNPRYEIVPTRPDTKK